MSLLAYLDTNVYDHLYKKTDGVTDADELDLRAAVSSGRLTIALSHTNIRETLAALHRNPEIVGRELSLIANLANWNYFVRFHSVILQDDIRHFAYNGERANTAFEDERTVAMIRHAIDRVIDSPLSAQELEAVNRESWEQKRAFFEGVKKSRAESEKDLEEFQKKNETPNFEQYFEEGAEAVALAFAQSFWRGRRMQTKRTRQSLEIIQRQSHGWRWNVVHLPNGSREKIVQKF